MKVVASQKVVDGRLQVHIDLQIKGDLTGHPFRGNQWTVGGGSRSVEEVKQAIEKLDALPSAEEGYRHFDDDIDQIRTLSFGFAGVGKLFGGIGKTTFTRTGVEMELDPAKVFYGQISVTREGVRRKLTGDDPKAEEFGAMGLPTVVLENGKYYLQNGFHRAAADVLMMGKFRAVVAERVGTRWRKPDL